MGRIDYFALGIKPQNTFDHLVIGPHNQMAVAACTETTKFPGDKYNPLYIFGPAGVGKTHIIQAVALSMLAKNPELKVKYTSSERFTNEVISAVADDNVLSVRQHYSQLDLLVVDDVQFLMESKATQGEFFHVFNNLHQQNKQVVMAADRPPNQLLQLDQTVRSRLEWGLAVDVKIPDVASRVQILSLKQGMYGLSLDDEVLTYVAGILKSNVRELEGFLKRLNAYITLSHQTLSMELIEGVVKEVLPAGFNINQASVMKPSLDEPAPLSDDVKKEPKNGKKGGPHPPQTGLPPDPSITTEPPPKGSSSPSVPEPPSLTSSSPTKEKPPPAEESPPPPPDMKMEERKEEPKEEPPESAEPPSPSFEDEQDLQAGVKEIGSVFFFPKGKQVECEVVLKKFLDVIKKHKLKFRLKRVTSHEYDYKGKINYSSFVDVCKANKVPVAIVIGPPAGGHMPEQDFYDLLSVTLDVQGVSLQLVNWAEIDKDYRYLNLALDIALVRTR